MKNSSFYWRKTFQGTLVSLICKHYEEFDSEEIDSEIMDPVQCKAEFRVEKNALRSVAETPDLRHRILNWISEN